METPLVEDTTVAGPRPGEWVFTAAMLGFFAAAYVLAEDFPFRAALLPKMVSALGLGLCLVRFVGLVRDLRRSRRRGAAAPAAASTADKPVGSPPPAASPPAAASASGVPVVTASTGGAGVAGAGLTSELAIVDDDVEDDASMEYVFASADGRAWLEALSWIVVFFVAFFALGAFLAVPLFALFYLRLSGGASWLAAGIYAAVTGVLIYLAFRQLIYIPLPAGVLPFMQI